MPVITVGTNHPTTRAVCTMAGERLHAPTCTSPPGVAKTKATAVMHDALASVAPKHCVDAASFAGASFATITSAMVTLLHLPSLSISGLLVAMTIQRWVEGMVPLLGASSQI